MRFHHKTSCKCMQLARSLLLVQGSRPSSQFQVFHRVHSFRETSLCPPELALHYCEESSSKLQLGNKLFGSAFLSIPCTAVAGAIVPHLSWHRKEYTKAHLHQMYLFWHHREHRQRLPASQRTLQLLTTPLEVLQTLPGIHCSFKESSAALLCQCLQMS